MANDRPGPIPDTSDEDIIEAVRSGDTPVMKTIDVADALPISRRAVSNRLNRLHDEGRVESMDVGAKAKVWWIDDDSPTRVVDFRDHDRPNDDFKKDGHPDYVYIGRDNSHYGFKQSMFHNPFKVDEDGTRQEVIEQFREYFYDRLGKDNDFREAVHDLRGKTLGCWCKPEDCHGDVIAEYIES